MSIGYRAVAVLFSRLISHPTYIAWQKHFFFGSEEVPLFRVISLVTRRPADSCICTCKIFRAPLRYCSSSYWQRCAWHMKLGVIGAERCTPVLGIQMTGIFWMIKLKVCVWASARLSHLFRPSDKRPVGFLQYYFSSAWEAVECGGSDRVATGTRKIRRKKQLPDSVFPPKNLKYILLYFGSIHLFQRAYAWSGESCVSSCFFKSTTAIVG